MTQSLIEEAIDSPTVEMEAPQPDLSAAHELPPADLDRGEALDLLTAVFGPAVEQPAGIFNEMPEARFINDHAAVMAAGSLAEAAQGVDDPQSTSNAPAESSMIESFVPLRTEDEAATQAPVDLSLERRDGELQPENPLVDTSIPTELTEGVELAGGEVELHFPGVANRAPSTIEGNSAFYPNVAEDADLVIAPTATGIETLKLLRTPSAPHHEVQRLTLPEGAHLTETDWGGAEATINGRTLLEVPPPTAIDAAGNSVPMTLEVSGDSLELTVSPSAGTVYPVLADPNFIVSQYNWAAWGSTFAGWWTQMSSPGYLVFPTQYPTNIPAIDITSGFPGAATPNSGGQWLFEVPRLYSDLYTYGEYPKSWIEYVSTEAVMFLTEGNNRYFPMMVNGILDIAQNNWVSVGTYNGTQGSFGGWSGSFAYPNYGNTNAKLFSFGLITLENEAQSPYRNAVAGQVQVELRDEDTPGFTSLSGPPGWWDTGEPAIQYAAIDRGLGVRQITVTNANGKNPKGYPLPCSGANASPCPRIYKSTEPGSAVIRLNAATAPEGLAHFNVHVTDPLFPFWRDQPDSTWHISTPQPVTIRVDHSPPELALTGSLTEQATLGTNQPHYTLKYGASDGVKQPATIFTGFGTEGSGAGQFRYPSDVAIDPSENIWVADLINNRLEEFSPSTAFLAAYSAVGASDSLKGPTAVESDANGNIWVADTGNNRLVEFNSKGEWIRKVGKAGSGNSEFSSPQGIAVAPDGSVWVADTGNHRIQKFSSTGSFIASYGAYGGGEGQFVAPSGLDVAPNGNVWVADTANSRVQELNANGEFIASFSSFGSGADQFSRPIGVEVDGKGNVYVLDGNNGRVVQLSERGEYLSQFGSKGSGFAQFLLPANAGLATNAAGEIWIADSGNNRIHGWDPAKGTRSGLRSVVVKIDGKSVQNPEVACPQGGCPLSGKWTLDSGEYGAGSHSVEVTATDGVNLSKTEKLNVTLDPPVPTVNLSGTVTEQATVGYTRPGYTLKVNASAEEGTGSVPAAPSYLSSFGSTGSGSGQFSHPAGIAIDSGGILWVADTENNRIEGFNSAGTFIKSVGSAGSGPGQFSRPTSIAIDRKGNFWVADAGNHRLEQFSPSWDFIQVVGSAGSGNGQFDSPEGIAVDLKGNIWVSDTNNHRVQKLDENGEFIEVIAGLGAIEPTGIAAGPGGNVWITDSSHDRVVEVSEAGTLVRSFGGVGSGSGQFRRPGAVTIDNSGNVWIGDRDNRRVQAFNQNGEYIAQFGVAGAGAGQFNFSQPIGIATDAKGYIWVSDTGNNRVQRWRQPFRSRVTTEVTVDGNVIDSSEARCTTETCPITRSLRLESSTGTHTLVVKATDGYGQWTSKTRTFKVEADTTKPTLQIGGELANAPEGWVQQESYGFNASAADPGESGVTSLVFRIDGSDVASSGAPCSDGACEASISKGISTAPYSGGAHEAEVIAADSAGNKATKKWTINVDPEGYVSTAEAKATLEAVEVTTDANPIGDSQVEDFEGTAPGLGIEENEGEFVATGTSAPVEIEREPAGGFTVEVPEAGEFAFCPSDYEALEEGESPEEPVEAPAETCEGPDSDGTEGVLVPIEVTPLDSSQGAALPLLVEENATVAANSTQSSDMVIRPLDAGGMVFQAIRDDTAPESYSYRVTLGEDQVLRPIDSQHAQVYYSGHEPAFLITAVPAHDAVGTTVPTSITVDSRDVITLHVGYKAGSGGQPFVYPVLAGTGWTGGFRTITVEMYNPEGEPGQEEENEEAEEGGNGGVIISKGATTRVLLSSISAATASTNSSEPPAHRYKFTRCEFPVQKNLPGNEIKAPPYPIFPPKRLLVEALVGKCAESDDEVVAAIGIWGEFHYKNGERVWVNSDEPAHCVKMKGAKYPVFLKNCGVQPKSSKDGITVRGDWRWPKSDIHPVSDECETMYGHLNASRPHQEGKESIWYAIIYPENAPCPWPAWPH